MNILRSIVFLFISLVPVSSFALAEFNFDFGYDRQIYGDASVNANKKARENSVVSRNYSAGVSLYLFELTAVDLNYSNSQDITSQHDRYTVSAPFDVIAQQNRVRTQVYGIGIKQMLVGRGSRLIPVISAGYAKEFVESAGDITVENTTTNATMPVKLIPTKNHFNSVFGSFTLQLKLTERFSLKGTVRTLFPAFEFSKARDNVKYLVGFSWII